MKYHIALLPGDGIGPEVVVQAKTVLEAVGKRFGREFSFETLQMGGCAIDQTGQALPASTLEASRSNDAILLGAVGGPRWDGLPGPARPEAGLLALRSGLGVYANLRPTRVYAQLASSSPLRLAIGEKGFDLVIVRELTGGIYFGKRGRRSRSIGNAVAEEAWDTERYDSLEIRRLLQRGFELARSRSRKLCVVDKANVLETSRLWREVAKELSPAWSDVELSFMYVDNCAMQLIRDPRQFDVIATSNLFGDILSDEAAMLSGSIGMLASASLGDTGPGLYEPIHGSAPDIAGRDVANPLAAILSSALLLRHSLGLEEEARAVETAVEAALAEGLRCADIAPPRDAGPATPTGRQRLLGTAAMGGAIAERVLEGKEGGRPCC